MEITVEWNPEYNEASLKDEVKNAIVDKMIATYMTDIEKSFTKKLETQILKEANKIVKGMSKIYVDKCNTSGVKESMTIDQFIIQTATESLTKQVDEYGQYGHSARSDKRTAIDWFIKRTLDKGNTEFITELKNQCTRIQEKYKADLENMVNKTLAPLYKKLREQVKA